MVNHKEYLQNNHNYYQFREGINFLFNERKCCYIKNPLWLYRISEYSAGLEVIDGKQNNEHHRKIALKKIKEKYFRLWNEKKKLNHTTNTI